MPFPVALDSLIAASRSSLNPAGVDDAASAAPARTAESARTIDLVFMVLFLSLEGLVPCHVSCLVLVALYLNPRKRVKGVCFGKAHTIMASTAELCYNKYSCARKSALKQEKGRHQQSDPRCSESIVMTALTRKPERILLTGLTGLVGSSVAVALARAMHDCDFVCLVRDACGVSAKQRMQSVLHSECEFEGCPDFYNEIVNRVSVIEGDVTSINATHMAKNPMLKGVTKVLHCAADVNLGKDPTGRVFSVNYDGTKHVIELAKSLGVREFHYVATAYVAGNHTGVAYEHEQHPSSFNNAYEESKCLAEHLVRESGIPFTVYRPGIIVGRKSDGRIRKPLAFYRILEFLQQLKGRTAKRKGVPADDWIEMNINCHAAPSSHIYFVPIDYVQSAISTLFQKRASGITYHVTGDHPVSAEQILHAVCQVFRISGISISTSRECNSAEERMFTKFIGDLFPYFSSDIVFDQSNIRRDFAGLATFDYGSADLKALIQSYLADHFKSTDWVRNMLSDVTAQGTLAHEQERQGNYG